MGQPPTQPGYDSHPGHAHSGHMPPTQPGAGSSSYDSPAAYPGAQQPGMPMGVAPYQPPGAMAPARPGAIAATGGGTFEQKSPAMLFLLVMVTCGIYALLWYSNTGQAMRAKGADIPPFWYILIPIMNIIWMWKWCQGLDQVSGGQLSAGSNLLKLMFLGGIGMAWLQSDMNKV
jgi:hypothetical protein